MPRAKKVAPQVETLYPMTPVVSREQYIQDIKIRWAIHTYEVKQLGDDIKDGIKYIRPYLAQTFQQVQTLVGSVTVK